MQPPSSDTPAGDPGSPGHQATRDSSGPITWAGLLALWTEVAQRAMVLPSDADGSRWRQAVPHAIGLHAIALSLAELDRLDHDDRPVAMDKAELAIREHSSALIELWRSEPMPDAVDELIGDARSAWELSLHEGLVWTVEDGEYRSPNLTDVGASLVADGFYGELLIAAPGVPMFPGAPVATVRDRDGGPPETWVTERVQSLLDRAAMRQAGAALVGPVLHRPLVQAYRQMDFARGGAVRDLISGVLDDLPAGQPLLIPVVSGGAVCPVPMAPRSPIRQEPLPVEWPEPEIAPDAGLAGEPGTRGSSSEPDI